VLPLFVAQAFASAAQDQDTPVLDIGAGTGLVGQSLAELGDWNLEALDPSQDMLDIAKRLGVYKAFHTQGLDHAPNGFGGVVSAGTFTHGHLGPGMLAPLVQCLRPEGLAVLSINEAHFEQTGFAAQLNQLPIRDVTQAQVPIYEHASGDPHDSDTALIITFRKT